MKAQMLKRQLISRTRFLWGNRDIGLGRRLQIAASPRMGRAAMRYLRHNCLHANAPEPHFRLNGKSIYFMPDYPVQDSDRLLQGISQVLVETYLLPELFHPRVKAEAGDIVLDLGGNIGTTALLFSQLVGPSGHVYVFEPIVHELCRKNINRNRAENVSVIPCGVSDRNDQIEFEVSDFCIDSCIATIPHHPIDAANGKPSAATTYPTRKVNAELVRLDDWMRTANPPRVDLIKMDIEGAEESAILGATELIARLRPAWSISSYHFDFSGEPQHPKLVRLLRELGYQTAESERRHIFAW